jgi:exonuclease VII small subunit
MAKKKSTPKKSIEEIVKDLEEKYGDVELSKEEFEEALKKALKIPKPMKPKD